VPSQFPKRIISSWPNFLVESPGQSARLILG
jgi:hypothetical protein